MFNIWVIDDDTELCVDVIEFWRKRSVDYPFDFYLFPTAKQALETLWNIPLNGKPAPDAVVVDGHLKNDKNDLNRGAVVIRDIVAIDEYKVPLLIGWSADPLAEEEMVRAGAQVSFGKTQSRDLIRYLQKEYDKRLS